MGALIEILRPGLLATVQDLGRPGLGRFGVSPSGAMDPLALRLANRLAGNPEGAPALELTGPGAEVRFLRATTFAIGGADLGATVDGVGVSPWRPIAVPAGARLALPGRVRGARAVLAVRGGLAVPAVLGSAATDLDAGLGPGRLARGSRLADGDLAALPPPASDAVRALLGAYDDPFTLRFVPQDDPALDFDARRAFAASPYSVSERSNRTGYRLRGPALPARPDPERLSEPLAAGAIQLPPDGAPILLMADRQTTGGYPRLGHLAAADRPKAAQLWPGDVVRFVPVTVDEARRAIAALEAAWLVV